MKGWKKHKDKIIPVIRNDIDTDQILPKQFMKLTERKGFGKHLFHNWRFLDDEGNCPNPQFILNQKEFSNRTILIAGENFGCGSSREHAPWAIANYGFKVIIAPSFADIFYSNCAKNGIALIPLQLKEINSILEKFKLDNNLILTVDLSTRKVKFENLEFSFSMDDSLANRIINKLDDIEMTLKNKDKIEKFEKLNFY